jgi:hypothetical protein
MALAGENTAQAATILIASWCRQPVEYPHENAEYKQHQKCQIPRYAPADSGKRANGRAGL